MGVFIISAFADEIDIDLNIQMDVLNKYNIEYIEIRGVGSKNIVKYSIKEVKKIKQQIDNRGFKVSAIGSPIGKIPITNDFRPHLDLFKHTIEIARLLETQYIRMFSFYIPEGENPLKFRDIVMKRCDTFINTAKDSGLILLLENEKDIYGDTAERCLDILETMKCNYLKIAFDPANFVQCDLESYPESFELLKDYIVYMHIKDACYKNHNVVPAGHGDGKIKEILKSLNSRNFEGFLSLEPHLVMFAGLEELERGPKSLGKPEGGPKEFVVALKALKKIISSIL